MARINCTATQRSFRRGQLTKLGKDVALHRRTSKSSKIFTSFWYNGSDATQRLSTVNAQPSKLSHLFTFCIRAPIHSDAKYSAINRYWFQRPVYGTSAVFLPGGV